MSIESRENDLSKSLAELGEMIERNVARIATLGRPVFTHEFAQPDLLRVELAGNAPAPTLEMIVNQLPADRTIVVGVPKEQSNG